MTEMDAPDRDFEDLLGYLRDARGFDFTGYKRPTLTRRIAKRMNATGVKSYAAYLDHLEVHPDEFPLLFDAILINVTAFFRDPQAWDALASNVVPQILARRPGTEPIRVWSAGSASGEEAFTAAIVFAEALGIDGFKELVKVYATDVDEDALSTGRQATYPAKALEAVDGKVRETYFTRSGSEYVFNKEMRRCVVFGRHDLVQDAPISKIDLLLCRNTLMYLNAETQDNVVEKFHFSLRDDGFLFLGKAETLLARKALFEPFDRKNRLYAKVAAPAGGRAAPGTRASEQRAAAAPPADDPLSPNLFESGAEAAPVAQILIGEDGKLAQANHEARSVFGLGAEDLGRPIQDLELSYRPLDLRTRIDTVRDTNRPVHEANVRHTLADGTVRRFETTITPVLEDGRTLGVIVTFVDVTLAYELQEALKRTEQELETIHEELETTNEELQSTVEELETTNEELQSTNEELETTNEELLSTNSEVTATNEELQRRNDEARRAEAFARSIMASLDAAIVVIDPECRVTSWNEPSYEIWGLRGDEAVGHPFFGLRFGLPLAEIASPVRGAVEGKTSETLVTAVNRLGRTIEVNVACHPLAGDDGDVLGAVIVMEPQGSAQDGAVE